MEEDILTLIEERHVKSGGHSGISPSEIIQVLGVDYDAIRDTLNNLHETNQILVRQGINGLLLFQK